MLYMTVLFASRK